MSTTVSPATGAAAKMKLLRAIRYTPAVTIVAAWMSAETGVGPAMASGSQMYSGIWALLPAHPRKKKSAMVVISAPPNTNVGATASSPRKSSVPKFANSRNIAIRNPKSPMRLTMNAFFPASALALVLNQNPINR